MIMHCLYGLKVYTETNVEFFVFDELVIFLLQTSSELPVLLLSSHFLRSPTSHLTLTHDWGSGITDTQRSTQSDGWHVEMEEDSELELWWLFCLCHLKQRGIWKNISFLRASLFFKVGIIIMPGLSYRRKKEQENSFELYNALGKSSSSSTAQLHVLVTSPGLPGDHHSYSFQEGF